MEKMIPMAKLYKQYETRRRYVNVPLSDAPYIAFLIDGLDKEEKKEKMLDFIKEQVKRERIRLIATDYELLWKCPVVARVDLSDEIEIGPVERLIECLKPNKLEMRDEFLKGAKNEEQVDEMIRKPLFLSLRLRYIGSHSIEKEQDVSMPTTSDNASSSASRNRASAPSPERQSNDETPSQKRRRTTEGNQEVNESNKKAADADLEIVKEEPQDTSVVEPVKSYHVRNRRC